MCCYETRFRGKEKASDSILPTSRVDVTVNNVDLPDATGIKSMLG